MEGSDIRLLVIAPVEREHQETAVGVDLARQLRAAGVDSHLVVDRYNVAQVVSAGLPHTLVDSGLGDRVRDVVASVAREFRPTAVVLADYVAHWLTLSRGYGVDPWFVEDLGVPVLPIDLYELDRSGLEAEIVGKLTRIDDRLLSMPAHLRPVPTAHPRTSGDHVFAYRAAPAVRPLSRAERTAVRARHGIGPDDPVLLVPTLEPQRTMARVAKGMVGELANRVPELVVDYLMALPDSTRFLLTGPEFDAYRKLPAHRTHLVGGTQPELLVGAADAVWSFYFPAASLEHALFAGVPGLLSTHSGDHTSCSPAVRAWLSGFSGQVPLFTLWPWGWVRLLEPVLRDNPFAELFTASELFDDAAVVGRLTALLSDEGARAAAARARTAYLAELDRLPPTADVVRAALAKAGAAV